MFEEQREAWQRRSASARLGIALGSLAILVALIVGAWVAVQRNYQVLFSGLDPQDAATIVAELDRMKVPYKLGPDETTILVEDSQVHATRLKLMGKGVALRGGVGFEIFNTTDFGVTEFAQKINYQRALQGELARTIMALDAVKAARVHLVLPDSTLFRRTTQKPKASVALTLREGRSLQPEQVLGIQRLVAASVPQIDASAVTLLDQRGVTLSRNVDADGEEALLGLNSKHELETYLARKVVAVLDKAFGPGSAIVSVDVALNHDQVQTTRENVSPYPPGNGNTRAVLRSRTNVQMAAPGTGPSIVAAAAQDGAAPPAGPAAGPGRPVSSVSEIEYQNSRVVEQTVSRPGRVQRISVGVLLPNALAPDRLRQLMQLLSSAAGLDRERGDEIAISSIDQFSPNAASKAGVQEAPAETNSALPDMAPPALNPKADSRPALAIGGFELSALELAFVVVLGLTAIVLLVAYMRAQRSTPAPLSAQERERLLAQMNQWLRPRRS